MDWNKLKVHDRLHSIFGSDIWRLNIHKERNAGSCYNIAFSLLDADEFIIWKILDCVQGNITFHFFDYFHPQLSDTGAYLTLMKTIEGNLCYRLGNHGWESDVNSITCERAVRYILKNVDYNRTPEQCNNFSLNFGQARPIVDPKEESINLNRLRDTGRKIENSKVYELNNSYLLIEDESNLIIEGYYLFSNKKSKKKIRIGFYLTEASYIDFINEDIRLSVNSSVDRTIKVKIRSYVL